MSSSVYGRDITAVGDGMTTLNGLPCSMLRFSCGGFFGWMPADGSGAKEDFGTSQCREAGSFGIPLVPANQNADFTVFCFPCLKALITGSKIEFLVVKRIIRNMHFSVCAE